MKLTYCLYIDGAPQPDYAGFTAKGLEDANKTNEENWPGYEWRREDRPVSTPFTVRAIRGTIVHFLSHAHREKFLQIGGLDDWRRRYAEFNRTENQVEKAA